VLKQNYMTNKEALRLQQYYRHMAKVDASMQRTKENTVLIRVLVVVFVIITFIAILLIP
jgi:hypothetical protein